MKMMKIHLAFASNVNLAHSVRLTVRCLISVPYLVQISVIVTEIDRRTYAPDIY